ncbi:MAG: hypothetical protein ACK5MT_06885 [Actinomycetales bacterium]
MTARRFHRPTLFGPLAMDTRPGGADPAERHEAAYATARVLVLRGREEGRHPEALQRLVELADSDGLEVLAELWSDAPADSLPGALWRVYLLRSWVRADPRRAATEFDEGRRSTPVLEAVAGVAEPPGPDQVLALADAVLHGVYDGDFAIALQRAAAFARVVAVGRARTGPEELPDTLSAARLVRLAENLEAAAASWRTGDLQVQ